MLKFALLITKFNAFYCTTHLTCPQPVYISAQPTWSVLSQSTYLYHSLDLSSASLHICTTHLTCPQPVYISAPPTWPVLSQSTFLHNPLDLSSASPHFCTTNLTCLKPVYISAPPTPVLSYNPIYVSVSTFHNQNCTNIWFLSIHVYSFKFHFTFDFLSPCAPVLLAERTVVRQLWLRTEEQTVFVFVESGIN